MTKPFETPIRPRFNSVQEQLIYLKQRLAVGFRLFTQHGFDEGVAGRITARDPEHSNLVGVNPFGRYFGHISETANRRLRMKSELIAFSLMAFLTGGAGLAKAHCEIPCGIYGDDIRLSLLQEHIATIEKSMREIADLSKAKKPNYNQLVRWVTNKEAHAVKFQEIVSQYFLHQRIKPVEPSGGKKYEKYILQLTLAHKMLVAAIKSKTTTDLAVVEELKTLLAEFRRSYP